MTDNYQILIQKLDSFIRKYYKNQIIRGVIYSIAALLLFFLTIALLEYFTWLGTTGRTIIFYLYLFISSLIVFGLILIPTFKLFKIGSIISHRHAAEIIGKHFGNVEDKLLNTLQLKELSALSPNDSDLINASIDQRISGLKPIPFSNAIDLKGNKKYLKFALPPVLIIIVFLIAAPTVITDPTTRIIKHNENFEKSAPFKFVVENELLQAIQQDDFTVELKIEGESVPESVMIYNGATAFRMKKKSNINFTYTFRNLQKDLEFSFEADGYNSIKYDLKVLPKPIILNFETEVKYPSYIGKNDDVFENTGDLVIPEGTEVKWKFYTRDTDALNVRFGDSTTVLAHTNSNVFTYNNNFLKSQTYSVSAKNNFLRNNDSLLFAISVIPDIYPSINIEEFHDSISNERVYFRGFIKDDYGFKKLGFFYKYTSQNENKSARYEAEYLNFQPGMNQLQFFHSFDITSLNLKPGEEVEYFFEVWDNDAINGSKSSRSQKMIYKAPSLEELQEKAQTASNEIKSDMESALKDLQLLQREIEDVNKDLFQKNTLSWQDKQQIEDLLSRHKSIQEKIEDLQEQNKQKMEDQQKFDKLDDDLLQKQKDLQEMMEDLLTDEMKQMMEEIQKLLDELDKDKVSEMMEEMKMSNEDLEEQLDRNLELFKQFEFEQKLQETIDKLEKLSEEQDQLSQETEQNKDGEANEESKEKQEELNKKFDELRKDMDDLEKKNQALENPNQMENTDSEEQDIQESMEESSDQLEQNKNSKASKSQKSSSQKMKQLSEKMQQMMDSMMKEEMGEDINTLREILENLIQISFDQESLMNVFNEINTNDPKYTELIKEQQNLKDDMEIIADSLNALAKRQIMIKPFVMKELKAININIDKSLVEMDGRRKGNVLKDQQLTMTSMNNLALLLGESLEQMQQQMMQMQSSGQGTCSKPGKPGGSQQMKSMKGLQEQLNEQLKGLREGKKPGEQGKNGQSGQKMSEQLARMAAEQAAIRRKMESFRDQLKEEGRFSDGNVSKMIEDMEQTEKDIVNNRITKQTLERQEEILTRLLKSEKAEQQREEEQRRESKEARNPKISNPDDIFDYNKIKNREVELLKTLPPNLKPFYKNKVTEYFYRFD